MKQVFDSVCKQESDRNLTDFNLAEGVQLHVINETKFKTVRIMMRFREPIKRENLAKRVLLSNMLETTNAVYTTGKSFSRKLSELFGMSFSTGVAKKGRQHLLTINMNLVNPKFVNFDVLSEAVEFLKTALFRPDITGDTFNSAVFGREQTNLLHYLESMNDDHAYYASRKLSDLFFNDKNQSLPSVATVELIKKENPKALLGYYQKMLQTNGIDIFVLGDVNEQRVVQLFSTFKFSDRTVKNEIFYTQEVHEDLSALIEKKEAAQSILQFAYHFPMTYGDADYLALQVMNGLLGGFAHSKLFTNVREKASLAYSISSTFDSFTSFFKIAAGIDAANFEQTRQLIFEQVKAMQDGEFSDFEIEQTKTMLRNSYFIGQDSASNNIEMEFVRALLPRRFMDTDAFLTGLSKVTKADIQRTACALTLQAQYFMEGIAYEAD